MKSFLINSFLVLTIFFNAVNSNAQSTGNRSSDSVRAKEEVKNSLRSGQWALLFGIGSNFTLTNFSGSMIAGKYHFSSKSALRLDFNLDYLNRQEKDQDYTEFQDRNYGGNLTFLYYLNPKAQFNIYLGIGINFSYSYYFQNYETEDTYYENTTWLTGPKIGAGAEFFVFNSMSLFAEYNYIIGFGEVKRDELNNGIFHSHTFDITSFRSDYVKFGLSVYF